MFHYLRPFQGLFFFSFFTLDLRRLLLFFYYLPKDIWPYLAFVLDYRFVLTYHKYHFDYLVS